MRIAFLVAAVVAMLAAGCASPTPSPSTTTTTPPTQTSPMAGEVKIVHESFDKTLDNLPSGWRAIAGNWSVVPNLGAPSAPNVLQQTATNLAFPLVVNDNAGAFSDVNVTVKFNVQSGEKAQAGGVAFRFVDAKNYYVARANGNEGNFALFRTMDGNRMKIMEAESPTGIDTWLTITAQARGEAISVYSGSALLFTYTETEAKAPAVGLTGVWTKDDSITLFDDFDVTGTVAN